jgi:hypothetical protein
MNCRDRGLNGLLLLAALAAGPAHATLFKGDVTDARTGRSAPATVKSKERGAGFTATIRCKPAQGCPLAKKTKARLARTGDQFHHTGSFPLHGVTCALDVYVYGSGSAFQATYSCPDGSVGSISGVKGGRGGGDYQPPR